MLKQRVQDTPSVWAAIAPAKKDVDARSINNLALNLQASLDQILIKQWRQLRESESYEMFKTDAMEQILSPCKHSIKYLEDKEWSHGVKGGVERRQPVNSTGHRRRASLDMAIAGKHIVICLNEIAKLEMWLLEEYSREGLRRSSSRIVNSFGFAKGENIPCNSEWWSRPLWAWTTEERMFAHGALILADLEEALRPTRVKICISNRQKNLRIDPDNTSVFQFSYQEPKRSRTLPREILYQSSQEEDSEYEDFAEVSDFESPLESAGVNHDSADFQQQESCWPEVNGELLGDTLIRNDTQQILQKEQSEKTLSSPVIFKDSFAEALDADKTCRFSDMLPDSNGEKDTSIVEIPCDSDDPDQGPTCRESPSIRQARGSVTQSQSTQVDSQGVDISLLSQLPPSMRSEVRLALAVQGRSHRKRQNLNKTVLGRWLKSSPENRNSSVQTKRSRVDTGEQHASKTPKGTLAFFGKSGPA